MICVAFEVHVTELIRQNQSCRTLARLERAELVILHVFLVDDLGAKINVLDLLLLHLVVFFLSHHSHVFLVVLVWYRVLGGDVVEAAVQGLLLGIFVLNDVVQVDVHVIGVSRGLRLVG